jgi:hypothetical protein
MQSILAKAKRKAVIFLLPWIATMVTSFPYNNRASRFLDHLVSMAEAD